MPVYKYGTQEAMPEGYQPIRDILANMGYTPENIGYNAQNKNPILMGKELDASKMILGSDERYYATPNILNSMIAGLGITTPASSTQSPAGTGIPQMQPYQSQYSPQIEALLTQILNRPQFQFNPQTDPGFQQASKQIQNQVMLDFARRNMLYSPATGEAVSQGIANALPQFEQMAYNRYMDETNMLYNQLNVLLNMDDQNYRMYKDRMDYEWRAWEANRQLRLDQINEQTRLIELAYKKLDELEYADNEVAAILGIPVGTKSQAAKARAEELQNRLELMKREEEINARQQARAFENEKALITLRDQLARQAEERQKVESEGTPEQQKYYQEFLKLYTTPKSYGTNWAENPLLAVQNVIARQAEHEQLLGPALYQKLLNTLQSLASINSTMQKQKLDYESNPQYSIEMSYAETDPEGWLENYSNSYQDYINAFGPEGTSRLVKLAEEKLSQTKSSSANAKYEEYYRLAETNPKEFKKMMKDSAQRAKIIDEVGIANYEKLKAKAQED